MTYGNWPMTNGISISHVKTLGPQILPDIHIPNQPMQVIRMEVQQFGSFRKVTAGLFNSFNDQLALHAVDGFMVAEVAADTGGFLPLDKSFRQIFGPDVLR